MKKIFSMILTLSLVFTMLSACGKADTGTTTAQNSETKASEGATTASGEATTDASKPVTIKWAVWDIDATAYYQPLIDAFQKENSNITVKMIDLGSSEYETVLATQLAGGANDLDVITVKTIPSYVNMVDLGMLEPLNDKLTTDPSLYGGVIEQLTVDDKFYAVPFRADFWLAYYNKALFDTAGVEYPDNDMTWAEYDELARKVTTGKGAEKVYGSYYHIWRSVTQLPGVLDGKHTIIDGNYDFLKPYYERVLKAQKDEISMDYGTLKTSSTHYSGVFYNNQAAMMTMGSWFIGNLIEKTKTGENLATEWGIIKLPHDEGVEPGTTLSVTTPLAINSYSTQKDAAAAFVNFVGGEKGAEVLAGVGSIPAIKSDAVVEILSTQEGFPTDENSKEALKTVKTFPEMPMTPFAADIDAALNSIHDNIMTENIGLEAGIKEMNEKIQAILKG